VLFLCSSDAVHPTNCKRLLISVLGTVKLQTCAGVKTWLKGGGRIEDCRSVTRVGVGDDILKRETPRKSVFRKKDCTERQKLPKSEYFGGVRYISSGVREEES